MTRDHTAVGELGCKCVTIGGLTLFLVRGSGSRTWPLYHEGMPKQQLCASSPKEMSRDIMIISVPRLGHPDVSYDHPHVCYVCYAPSCYITYARGSVVGVCRSDMGAKASDMVSAHMCKSNDVSWFVSFMESTGIANANRCVPGLRIQ
jgi:hypothetical protein